MWTFYDRLIDEMEEDVLIEDFMIGPRWAAVFSSTGSIGISPVIIEQYDRFDFSYQPQIGDTLKHVAAGSKKWNFFEASLGLAAINAYFNGVSDIYKNVEHISGGRRSKTAFKNFCATRTSNSQSLMVEPYYDSYEMDQIPGRIDVIRRITGFRDYIYPAYRELVKEVDRVILSGTAIVDHTAPQIIEYAKEQEKEVIFWGPDVPLTPVMSEFGIDELWGFVVDDKEKFILSAKTAMNRDDMLRLGHFAGLQLQGNHV